MAADVKAIMQRHQALNTQRQAWDSLWQELADICHPRRSQITTSTKSGGPPDTNETADSFDNTAQQAANTLAQGQAARITPMGARWFTFKPTKALAGNAAARRWYALAAEIVAEELQASNYYSAQFEVYMNRGVFGTAAKEITLSRTGRLHFRVYETGSYNLLENEEGRIDGMTREYDLTPRQIKEAFPEGIPSHIAEQIDKPDSENTKHTIVHAILPRTDRDPRKIDKKNKPYQSVHILKEKEHLLAEEGFDEFPIAASRWMTWGDTPYGWPPAYLALPVARQASFLETMQDVVAENHAYPRVLVGDGTLKSDIDFRPAGVTFIDPTKDNGPQEWLTGARYDVGKDRLEDKRRAIREAFMVPLFEAVSHLSEDATATHVNALLTESRELFHPIFAAMIQEDQTPTLRRVFALLMRSGTIPPPPPAVIQRDDLGAFIADPEVEMTSQLALALEKSHLHRFTELLATLGPLIEADPDALLFLNTQEIGPELARFQGLPESFIRTPEEIAQIQEARAQAQQAQELLQMTEGVRNLGGVQETKQLLTP